MWAIFDDKGFIKSTLNVPLKNLADGERQKEVPDYVNGLYRIDMDTMQPVKLTMEELAPPPELITQMLVLMFKAGIATADDIDPDDLVRANAQLKKVGKPVLE